MEYNKLATKEVAERTVQALAGRYIEAFVVADKEAAMAKIKELIPAGASVMNGSSVTLEQMGFVEYLKSTSHPWNNLHTAVVAEKDPLKKAELRQKAIHSDYYLGSVHAIAETGELVIASNTGSQLPPIVFTSPNLIFVASTKKIVPTLSDAMNRLYEHVIPLEEVHMQEKYKVGTFPSKILIFNREFPQSGRKVRMILVNEDLGF